MNYKKFIESRFRIVDKEKQIHSFVLNKIQDKFLKNDFTGYDIVLKARQMGFSSLITAMFTADFILEQNSYSVIVADIDDNAVGLLSKVKHYIQSYEEITKQKVPLKYNSKTELYNPFMNTTFHIGTAKNVEFGRSRTISNLHLSELAFYPDVQGIIAGAGQAVTEKGKFIIETTANGFNDLKTLWEESKNGQSNFKPHFYRASDFYSQEFLDRKRVELKEKFSQEYPENDTEAFLTSGDCYFNKESLKIYYDNIRQPIKENLIYA